MNDYQKSITVNKPAGEVYAAIKSSSSNQLTLN
jgi:hypothetical protein